MTIYRNGKEVEKITLHELKTKKDMHAMFQQKGFRQLTDQEKARKATSTKEKRAGIFQSHKKQAEKLNTGTARVRVGATPAEKKQRQDEDELLQQLSSSDPWQGPMIAAGLMLVVLAAMAVLYRKRRRSPNLSSVLRQRR